jgi:hypothetical protein
MFCVYLTASSQLPAFQRRKPRFRNLSDSRSQSWDWNPGLPEWDPGISTQPWQFFSVVGDTWDFTKMKQNKIETKLGTKASLCFSLYLRSPGLRHRVSVSGMGTKWLYPLRVVQGHPDSLLQAQCAWRSYTPCA